MANKDELLKGVIDDVNNPSIEAMTLELINHLSETDIDKREHLIKHIAAYMNEDIITASGVSGENQDAKREFINRRKDLISGINIVVVGDRLIENDVSNENVGKTAQIIIEEAAFAKDGIYKVNGKEVKMDEESKNTELSRKFVEIISKGKGAITKAFAKAKEGVSSLVKFLGIKKKEMSEKWHKMIESLSRKCDTKLEKLIEKANLTPTRSVVRGPSV